MITQLLDDLGIENPEKYLKDFAFGKLLESNTLQQAFDISIEQMDLYYRDAYTFYEQEQFKLAVDSFQALCILDPFFKKHWMGLGGAAQMMQNYEKALRAYGMASLLDDDDPYPHFYAYQCLSATQQNEDAQKALNLAVERCNSSIYLSLKKKIREKLQIL